MLIVISMLSAALLIPTLHAFIHPLSLYVWGHFLCTIIILKFSCTQKHPEMWKPQYTASSPRELNSAGSRVRAAGATVKTCPGDKNANVCSLSPLPPPFPPPLPPLLSFSCPSFHRFFLLPHFFLLPTVSFRSITPHDFPASLPASFPHQSQLSEQRLIVSAQHFTACLFFSFRHFKLLSLCLYSRRIPPKIGNGTEVLKGK